MSFTHLHVHSEYSLLDGACRIGPMLDKIKSMGQSCCAVTDHGVMYGALDFYKEAKDRGIKPIIGCEVYVTPGSRHSKIHAADNKRYHLILLCKNETGYKNLIKIVSESWVSGFYIKPRVDMELLEKYHEGLICLSGCLFGEVSQHLLNGDFDEAEQTALRYKNLFGEDYYLEIQNHNLKDQLTVNGMLVNLSRKVNVPLIATNDAHYINKEDSIIQKILVCLATNHILGEDTGIDFETDEFYLKSEEEMLSAFSFYPEAVLNTQLVADKCNFDFEFGNTKLPHFDVPDGIDHIEWFNNLCREGFIKRYGTDAPKEYEDRLNYELDVINSMGYTDYYLIVHDFISYAKSKGIPVGPGRGSGAASICAYCIGITGIDPMKYNLLFERFLNPERVSMPDFDIDFCYERRQEVIEYVNRKYGSDHVAQIVTFGTMAAKQSIRDIARVKGTAYSAADRIAKLIPFGINVTIKSALEESSELRNLYNNDPDAKEIIELALRVEGMPRHASTHAAGIVITADPVDSYVPLALNDESTVTQFTMKGLEKLGLLKMDFLGLRTLTVIKDTCDSVREINPSFDIDNLDLNDEKTYDMFSSGNTEGVFQFESDGMRKVLTQMKPENLEDLIAVIALYRPGPMKYIDTYIKNRKNPDNIKYDIPALKDILDITYGCMIYQEQVMQICREVAGYSYGRADIVRRAMSKKQHDVMLKEREAFVNGAVARNAEPDKANRLFDEMISFASYAFNKAHAAAYAYVSYQTAYLRCHFPEQYFAALLTSFIDRPDKIAEYISVCSKLHIRIIPPHINMSTNSFSVRDGKIIFCLSAVKNVGRGLISGIIAERNRDGNFKSFYDFCSRMTGKEFNRRACESLIKCGALDNLGLNRKQMLLSLDSVLKQIEGEKYKNISGQIGFDDIYGDDNQKINDFDYPEVEEFPEEELLRLEKEVMGIYVSGNPLARYSETAKTIKADTVYNALHSLPDNSVVTLLCLISEIKKKTTKNNNTIAFITIEDETEIAEAIAFSSLFEQYKSRLIEGRVIILHGKVSYNDDTAPSIIIQSLEDIPDDMTSHSGKNTKEKSGKNARGLFLRFESDNSPQVGICDNLISIFSGNYPVYYYFKSSGKYIKSHSADADKSMISELSRILGKENVIFNE